MKPVYPLISWHFLEKPPSPDRANVSVTGTVYVDQLYCIVFAKWLHTIVFSLLLLERYMAVILEVKC